MLGKVSSLSKNVSHFSTNGRVNLLRNNRRDYCKQQKQPSEEEMLELAKLSIAQKFDLTSSVPNQFVTFNQDATKVRKLGTFEKAIWDLTSRSPRNIVCTIRTKDHVFSSRTLDLALGSIQRRHPFLHSGLMTVPLLGPYFVAAETALAVEEAPIRQPIDDTPPQQIFHLQTQQIIENELNRSFMTSHMELAHQRAHELAKEKLLAQRAEAEARQARQAESNEGGIPNGDNNNGNGAIPAIDESTISKMQQLPLLRARLVHGLPGCGQALVFSMPQLVCDAMSMTNVVKEVLEQTKMVEEAEAAGRVAEDPKYLMVMNNIESFYPAHIGGISGFFSNLKYWFKFLRYIYALKPSNFERWNAWLPENARTVKCCEVSVDSKTVKELKELGHKEGVTFGHTVGAATIAATHEVFFPDADEVSMPVQLWVDLRRRFSPAIGNQHLGVLVGRVQGLVKSSIGDSIWDIAKRVMTFDKQLPEDSFRSMTGFASTVAVDSKMMEIQRPTDELKRAPFQIAPVSLSNMGTIQLSESLVDHFHIDTFHTAIGQALNTRHTTVSTLPSGKMGITVTYPDTIYKRTDLQAFTESIAHHLQATAEGK